MNNLTSYIASQIARIPLVKLEPLFEEYSNLNDEVQFGKRKLENGHIVIALIENTAARVNPYAEYQPTGINAVTTWDGPRMELNGDPNFIEDFYYFLKEKIKYNSKNLFNPVP